MKKLLFVLSVFAFLVGCTTSQDETKEDDQESIDLQKQIENLMKQNQFKYKEIIDLDIIDNFIYSVSLNPNGGLDLAIISYNNGNLKWMVGDETATILQDGESQFMYIIQSDDPDVTQVNVFGEPAKAVTYYDVKEKDYTREIKYWLAYTNKEPTPSDVEYLKK